MSNDIAVISDAYGAEDQENEQQEDTGCTLHQFTEWMQEIDLQPAWRSRADKEADYYDGNQLNSDVLRRQAEIGMPPAIEPLIGPTIDSVLGLEAKTRTDWRVMADNDADGDEVAEAIGYKMNQSERLSGADRACSDAYASQIKVGIGWVEVSRDNNPFKYPHRCKAVHRNEIWWDFLSVEPDLSDARYLIRRRWTDRKQVELMFPDKAELVRHAGSGWSNFDVGNLSSMDGGTTTGLAMSMEQERGWSIEEQQWRDRGSKRVCLFEVWYRDWVRTWIIKSPDGRVIEFDEENQVHLAAVASGHVQVQSVVLPKMRMCWYLGCHKLYDGPTPYNHDDFPYVPFWGKREDRTNTPYGLIRSMIYLQDEVNARISKQQWLLSAKRTVRTKGIVAGTDQQFRNEISRADADIILDDKVAAKPGAKFEVSTDFELSIQQAARLNDAREGIKRAGGIYNAFLGQDGQANSGVAISGLVEQSTQNLADINDNFKYARTKVGELLMALVLEDMEGQQQEILIPGKAIRPDKTILLNVPMVDEGTGTKYLNNDVMRAKLKVVLNDVPSNPTYRAQQLSALSEVVKSLPQNLQPVILPHMLSLMDVPDKTEIIEAIKQAMQQPTPEQIQQQIQEAVDAALNKAQYELKQQELNIKEYSARSDAKTKNLTAEANWMNAETKAKQTHDTQHNEPDKEAQEA